MLTLGSSLRSRVLLGILDILLLASSGGEPVSSDAGAGLLLTGSSSVILVDVRTPVTEVVLGIVEDLSGLSASFVGRADIAWDDGGVVEELEEAHAMTGQDDLFLGAFDGGEELGIVGLLELLARLCFL